jgi:hypothetical protein
VAGQLGSPEKWRPDECGLMVNLRSSRPDGSDPVIEVHEVIAGALQNRERVKFLVQKAFDRYGKGVVYEFAHDLEIGVDSPVDGIPLADNGQYRMYQSCQHRRQRAIIANESYTG